MLTTWTVLAALLTNSFSELSYCSAWEQPRAYVITCTQPFIDPVHDAHLGCLML